jgi:hypothetical protein
LRFSKPPYKKILRHTYHSSIASFGKKSLWQRGALQADGEGERPRSEGKLRRFRARRYTPFDEWRKERDERRNTPTNGKKKAGGEKREGKSGEETRNK